MSYFEYEPSGIDEMEIVPFYLNIAVLRSGKVLSPRIWWLVSAHTGQPIVLHQDRLVEGCYFIFLHEIMSLELPTST